MKHMTLTLAAALAIAIAANAAPKKKHTPAYEDLSEQISDALNSYDIKQAQELMERWEAAAKRARRDLPTSADELRGRIVMMDNMLQLSLIHI